MLIFLKMKTTHIIYSYVSCERLMPHFILDGHILMGRTDTVSLLVQGPTSHTDRHRVLGPSRCCRPELLVLSPRAAHSTSTAPWVSNSRLGLLGGATQLVYNCVESKDLRENQIAGNLSSFILGRDQNSFLCSFIFHKSHRVILECQLHSQ